MSHEQPVAPPERYWLLTWTTYGTWLPGDRRGFVSNIRIADGTEVRHNVPQTTFDADLPHLEASVRNRLRSPPIFLSRDHADILLPQFQETARFRGWQLVAVAVMANHCHAVVGVPGDPNPENILRDLKSYGSRVLNERWPKPASGTWWTESGSKRKLPDEKAILNATAYVRDQEHPLVAWIEPRFIAEIGERRCGEAGRE